MGVSEENLAIVKEGMIKAVNETYSSVFGDFKIQVVGKTGTAEHGAKSSVAMNVAKKLLTQYFKDNPVSTTKETSKSQD